MQLCTSEVVGSYFSKVESATVGDGAAACQVSDFGLSMLMNPGQDQAQAMQHGTLAYMPPELIMDDALSFATDVYSFASSCGDVHCQGTVAAAGKQTCSEFRQS